MHHAGYRALGLPFTYFPFKVTNLADAMRGMRALGIRGLGISMPFKQAVIPLLDEIEPMASRIGAVNTVVNENGRLIGHNTDWRGAVLALEEATSLRSRRVLLLGAGGAARAIAFGLCERGAELTIANRDASKAEQLAAEFGCTAAPLLDVFQNDYEVIVNATSLGMNNVDARSPVPEDVLNAGRVVMDIVYNPLSTELFKAAHRRGATAIHGGRMLLHQAAEQFRLYTGQQAPLGAMDEALRTQLVD
ncbi:shikimate dehydrogenase [Chondromyces crocatus]|uniref:shikimate dehydrogenase (NADP(+)) n=1 Tax=Chondromyces crocatus TaxID=52 RepID=A0A0K1ENY3_CHOCO|nr:shikimate dehydrogenase [Chondromyces crocatus]AKT42333.1 shikimate dehydrogenase [Chondromyces crocatus]